MSRVRPNRQQVNKYEHLARRARDERASRPVKEPKPLPPVEAPPPSFRAVEAPFTSVDVIHFNDFHRQLEPVKEDNQGGVARLSTAIKRLQAEHPEAVTVNLGDVSFDSGPITGKNMFKPVPELFREMGVQILELGNHEFQDPQNNYAALKDGLIAQFNGEVLCGNVTDAVNNQPFPGTKPYTTKQLAGMNIAFIGVVTQDMATKTHPNVATGMSVANIAETLKTLVPKVRADGADAVVVLAHESYNDCKEVAKQVDGIDLLLAAHDHKVVLDAEQVITPNGGRTTLIEAGSHGQYLGHSRLVVDPAAKTVVRVEGHLIPIDRGIPEDPAVQKIVSAYREKRG
ncbi:MAG: hypothetical protein FJX76_02550 [Armatimonadetes bacterium]|nr:hypothetical protein [Armatimonadota bacterium]